MHLPLSDITILDLSRILSGPFVTMTLGDFGARVIKVESPAGDDTRTWGPPFVGEDAAYYLSCNRNKESIQLDLKSPEDRAVFARLVGQADVVVENFRPGTMRKLGYSLEQLQAINPKVILCSISGYGQTGPKSLLPGFDQIAQGMSGLMSVTGVPGGEPLRAGFSVADLAAAMWALFGIMAALRHRDRTSEGQWVDVALVDALISFQTFQAQNYFATGKDPRPTGGGHPNLSPYQVFQARDGHFNVAVGNQSLWHAFCTALGLEIEDDERFRTNSDRVTNRTVLTALLQERFSQTDMDEIVTVLSRAGVPAGHVYRISQVFADEQVLAREMVCDLERPDTGTIRQLGIPVKLSKSPGRMRSAPPRLGEHSEAIRREFSGG